MFRLWTVTLFASVWIAGFKACPARADEPHLTWDNRAVAEGYFIDRFGDSVSKNTALLNDAERAVDLVYNAYKALYPSFMSNKQKPMVVLEEDESAFGSFAFMPRMDGPRRGMLVVTEGLMKMNGIDRGTQMGIIAHEMAHILFWHQDTGGKSLRPILKSGRRVSSSTEQAFSRWMFLATMAGGHSLPALNGLPLNGNLGRDVRLISELIRDKGKGDCGPALLDAVTQQTSEIMNSYSYYSWGFNATDPASLGILDRASKTIISQVNSCILRNSILNEKFLHLKRYQIGGIQYPADQIFKRISPALNIFEDAPDFQIIIKASRQAHREMNEIYKREGFGDVRWYSAEDQADEAATTILKHLNIDHGSFASGVQSALSVPKKDLESCKRDLRFNREPPYGEFSDPHHSNCWRAWRIINYGNQNDRLPYVK